MDENFEIFIFGDDEGVFIQVDDKKYKIDK